MASAVLRQLPNAISIFRLLLGLAFPWIPPAWRLAAVLVAGVSDLFDGSLGRWTRSTSAFGRALDPIADKTFVLAVVATLVVEGAISPTELFLLCLRDVFVLGIWLWVLCFGPWSDFGRMKPIWSSKVATAGQFAYLVLLLARGKAIPELFWPVVLVSAVAGDRYLWLYVQSRIDREAFERRHEGKTPW